MLKYTSSDFRLHPLLQLDLKDLKGNIMYFKVPDLILREFVHIAGRNENNTGHIETMALLVGKSSSTETIVTKLIYPDQTAGPYEVRSEGRN